MVLYTPLSMHEIYPDETKPYKIISYRGKTVVAEQREDHQFQLVQLLSTDPQDFLEQSFVPGSLLKTDYS